MLFVTMAFLILNCQYFLLLVVFMKAADPELSSFVVEGLTGMTEMLKERTMELIKKKPLVVP